MSTTNTSAGASTAQRRSRYTRESVATASPARLVTMLYDRLARDLSCAELALAVDDLPAAHHELRHAQDIVAELSSSLEPGSWAGVDALGSLYTWLLEELVAANVHKDGVRVTACREVVEPLREAWHEAANHESLVS